MLKAFAKYFDIFNKKDSMNIWMDVVEVLLLHPLLEKG